ncbi:hypothetical protein D3C86_1792040 [compost metagenome]
MQIPTAAGNPDIGPHAACNLRPLVHFLREGCGSNLCITTDEQGQGGKLVVLEWRDNRSVLFDQRKFRSVLPDGESLALLEHDLDRARINLAHFRIFDPR